jgi:hypothetical protein
MAIDPSDYDVVGLRELARDRRGGSRGSHRTPSTDGGRPSIDDLAEVERDVRWLGSHDERHKPYLRCLPRREDLERVIREWLDRLVTRVGPDGAADALRHYRRLGWITESVETELRRAVPDGDGPDGGSVDDLTEVDHVHALSVIALARLGADGERLAAEGSSGG